MSNNTDSDHSAAIAVGLFMANLLFIVFGGIFYLLLWVLYLRRYKHASEITQHHLKQALIAATITSAIFIGIILLTGLNLFSLATGGDIHISLAAMLALDFYFMVIVPAFIVLGILAFIKAVRGEDFDYPLISRWT